MHQRLLLRTRADERGCRLRLWARFGTSIPLISCSQRACVDGKDKPEEQMCRSSPVRFAEHGQQRIAKIHAHFRGRPCQQLSRQDLSSCFSRGAIHTAELVHSLRPALITVLCRHKRRSKDAIRAVKRDIQDRRQRRTTTSSRHAKTCASES